MSEESSVKDVALNHIASDHDYAIGSSVLFLPDNRVTKNVEEELNLSDILSPLQSERQNDDIGYESMSSPETITNEIKQNNLNSSIFDEELLNNLISDENMLDKLTSPDVDFISEEFLQPSIDEMIMFENNLSELFPELFVV